jgi:hypothetical protein
MLRGVTLRNAQKRLKPEKPEKLANKYVDNCKEEEDVDVNSETNRSKLSMNFGNSFEWERFSNNQKAGIKDESNYINFGSL